MLYYRVKQEDDQRKRVNEKGKILGFYIAGELVTKSEAQQKGYETDRMELIETSRSNTYWCFGARFAADDNKVRIWQEH